MRMDVYSVIGEIKKEALKDADAVVIDVLRMTSTAVNAFSNGAKRIRLLGDEAQARMTARREGALLGGERGGVRLEGFDFGNSPFDYTPDRVFGKSIVMTTTNGARAAEAAAGAKSITLCSFLNVSAVAQSLKAGSHVAVICAGTHDVFSLDDCLCAGALQARLAPRETNDLAAAMGLLYEANHKNIKAVLSSAAHYRYLESIGFQRDLDFCLRTDTHACVPRANKDGWFECL